MGLQQLFSFLFMFFLLQGAFLIDSQAESGKPVSNDSILTPNQLMHIIDTNNNGTKFVIVEVNWGGPETTYNKGHVPGAIYLNTDEIEYDLFKKRSDTRLVKKLGRSTSILQDQIKGLTENDILPRNWWNLYPDQYLLPVIADMGIDQSTEVIVYGKDITAAARLGWTLLYAGVEKVKILNGGIKAWKKAGFDVSKSSQSRKPVENFGSKTAVNKKYLASEKYIRSVVNGNQTNAIVADIRTKDEYNGKTAPYSYIPTKGRIKGALWGHAGDGPWTMESYINKDGMIKNLGDIELMWAKEGITRDKTVSFYCGTAWRSSLAFFIAYSMGWKKINNFDSSWYGWSMGPNALQNPIETAAME